MTRNIKTFLGAAKTVLFSVLIPVFAAVLFCSTASAATPVKTITRNGHKYALYDVSATWSKASSNCKSLGGHLVTVTSRDEQSIVEELLGAGSRNSYWLGGSKSSGSWKWVTGESWYYSAWGSGQPDNFTKTETALMVYRVNNPKNVGGRFGTWNDLNSDGTCNGESFFGTGNFGYICEWDSLSIAEANITLKRTEYTYNGEAKKPSVTVVLDGVKLTEKTDYTVKYADNVDAGTATVTVKGKGDYTGSKMLTFTISPMLFNQDEFSLKLSKTSYDYNGKERKPSTTVKWNKKKLTKGTEYTVSYKNNLEAGTATATITGTGNYAGTLSADFEIKSLLEVSLSETEYTFTGKEITVKPVVKYKSTKLKKDKDYTLSYENNTIVGTAKVKVTGCGDYASKGSASAEFTIVPKSVASSNITAEVTWTEQQLFYTGSEVKPAIRVYDSKRQKNLNFLTDYFITYSNNVEPGIANAKITGVNNYKDTIDLTFEIKQGKVWPLGGAGGTWNGGTDYPRYSSGANHTGTDIQAPTGTEIRSAYSGTVVTKTSLKNPDGTYRSYGNYVVVESEVNGDIIRVYYCHMSAFGNISEGQSIAAGTKIGEVGSTGNSSGPHLHFEVRKKNSGGGYTTISPVSYLNDLKQYK